MKLFSWLLMAVGAKRSVKFAKQLCFKGAGVNVAEKPTLKETSKGAAVEIIHLNETESILRFENKQDALRFFVNN